MFYNNNTHYIPNFGTGWAMSNSCSMSWATSHEYHAILRLPSWHRSCYMPTGETAHAICQQVTPFILYANTGHRSCHMPTGDTVHTICQHVSPFMPYANTWHRSCHMPTSDTIYAIYERLSPFIYMPYANTWHSSCHMPIRDTVHAICQHFWILSYSRFKIEHWGSLTGQWALWHVIKTRNLRLKVNHIINRSYTKYL